MALRTVTTRVDLDHPAASIRPTTDGRSDFDVLFDELLASRLRYEDLRMSQAPPVERIAARDDLHLLRAAVAAARAEAR